MTELQAPMGILYDAKAAGLCIKLFREEGFAFE
jgi:hypothetical protein